MPVIDPRFSYRGEDVVQALDKVCTRIGYPTMIRVDQGTEFVSRDLDLWAHTRGVVLDFSRPGKPTDNAFMEAFNGRFASISTCSSTLKMLGKRWRLSAGTAMRSARHGAIGQKAPITLLARDGIPSPPS